jgi:shikimate kinase
MNILITGVAGSGKSTIANRLADIGHTAYDMDRIKGLCAWVDKQTREVNKGYKISDDKDWLDRYAWEWNVSLLTDLLKSSGNEVVFFCGSSDNQKVFYPLFSKIFLLEITPELIKRRVLENAREHDFGKKPGEFEAILKYLKPFQDEVKSAGANIISSDQPIDKILGTILD